MSYFKVGVDAHGRKKWRVRVQRGGRRLSRNVHGPERAAQQLEHELFAALENGVGSAPLSLTVSTYLADRWLPHIKLHRTPGTYARYRATAHTHLIPHIGHLSLDQVTALHVQQVLDGMLATGSHPKTVGAARGVLHKAFADAVRFEFIHKNPVARSTVPTVPKSSHRVLAPDELHQLFSETLGDPIEALLHVAVGSGARQGELLGLRWDHVDLDDGLIRIVGALKPVTGQGLTYGSTKENHLRSVDLGPGVMAVLRQHRTRQAVHRLGVGEGYHDRGYVFTHPDGRPIHPQTLRKWFKKLLRRTGIKQPWPRWHDLRHTHATLLLQIGIHPKVVAERVGHANTEVTTGVYSHVVPGMQRDAALKLDHALYGRTDLDGPELDLSRATRA
jgi:integrase